MEMRVTIMVVSKTKPCFSDKETTRHTQLFLIKILVTYLHKQHRV